ncbi:hypothetical protein [Promicromonospora sp. NFX87]|uniref:hypothetical protein n=1 Tax=Promicromonospora sp. NFX87 TaxID=3402691 RepID=UPI003AFA1E15
MLTNPRSILAALAGLDVELPAAVVAARAKHAALAKLNPTPATVNSFADRLIAADEKNLGRELDKLASAYAGEAERGRILDAAKRRADAAVATAILFERDSIVEQVLTAAPIAAAFATIAEAAPLVPRLTERSPSLERVPADVVSNAARVTGAYATIDALARQLAELFGFEPVPATIALLFASPTLDTREDLAAFVQAAEGKSNALAGAYRGLAGEAGKTGQGIPAVLVAHLEGVELAGVKSLAEFRERRAAFATARALPPSEAELAGVEKQRTVPIEAALANGMLTGDEPGIVSRV